jgi:hypothetical protein
MALPRQPKQECVDHTLSIEKLKNDMERIKDHEVKFNKTIERVEEKVDLLSDTTLNINANLLHFKDFPQRIRKLEDKSIVNESLKSLGWILLVIFITAYVGNFFVTKEERKGYKIESTK